MKKIILPLFIALLAMGTTSAQQSKGKLKAARKSMAEARQDLLQAQKDSVAEYQQFKKESHEKITANEKSISVLKAQKTSTNKETNANYNKKIQALENKNASMARNINNYKADGNTNWVVFKRKFNSEMSSWQKSFSSRN